MSVRTGWMALLAGALVLVGCGKPAQPLGDGHVRVRFVPQWEGAPFQASQSYINVMQHRILADMVKFYMAEAVVTGPSGTRDLNDIELIDITSGPGSRTYQVAAGTYSKLRFGLGVPPAMNASDPAIYPSGHPLSIMNGTYWTWATGYRFFMFDGRYDTDPNGTGTVLPTFSIHTGLDACYRMVELERGAPFQIVPGDTTELVVSVAVDRFFYTATDTIDISVDNQTHGTNLPLALRFTDTFAGSMTLE